MIIYLITNKSNNKKYIGCTSKSLKARFCQHIASSLKPKTALHKAINKYGADNFSIIEIEKCKNKLHMFEREVYYIAYYNALNSSEYYNCTAGGEGAVGKKLSIKTKELLRKAHTGKKHTLESKLKMSKSRKGKKFSDEHKKNLSIAQTGEKNHRFGTNHSEEYKNKIRESMIGSKNHFFNKKHSEQSKIKISKQLIGKFLGSKNPAARSVIYLNKKFGTGKELREYYNMPISKYYKLIKDGEIVYEDSV